MNKSFYMYDDFTLTNTFCECEDLTKICNSVPKSTKILLHVIVSRNVEKSSGGLVNTIPMSTNRIKRMRCDTIFFLRKELRMYKIDANLQIYSTKRKRMR